MNPPLFVRALLWPLSVVYGAYVRLRAWLYDRGWLKQERLRGKVISVGNLTVGGTGKTPMVLWLAEKFLAEGKRVAILSRGYRGSNGTSDEIELMKHRLRGRVDFGVGKDRFAEGKRIEAVQPVDVFLLDDGFQHRRLARDVDIVMLDGSRPLEDEWLLPAGALREPLTACDRADILVVTRKSERPDFQTGDGEKCPVFSAQTKLLGFRRMGEAHDVSYLGEIGPGPFFAFCGIGNPEAFFEDLSHWEVAIAGKRSFRDHHLYSGEDLARLKGEAQRAGAIGLVTTEKDAFNISDAAAAVLPIFVCVINLELSGESEFVATLDKKLNAKRGAAA